MCEHRNYFIRGNDEVGFMGATCRDCGEELLRRPVYVGTPYYEFKTAEEWDSHDAKKGTYNDYNS
jgi:hypothetical protein